MNTETKLEAAARRVRQVFKEHKTEALIIFALGVLAGAMFL